MRMIPLSCAVLALSGLAADGLAQAVPTTQPGFLQIYREQVKPGRVAEHSQWETGWPAAFERAKAPFTSLALASMTGPQEVWYVSPFASHAKSSALAMRCTSA